MQAHMDYTQIIAVTNRHLCKRPFLEQIRQVCEYHPKAIILREKDLSEDDYIELARNVMNICMEYQVPFIPHNYIQAARTLDISAVHLPLSVLRKVHENVLNTFTTIGTSVHSVEEAIQAEALGATYLTAGHVYATDCKKGLEPRGIEFLQNVCQSVHIPVYGIGGIKLNTSQLTEVLEAGAAGSCIMSGMMEL